tara:strand:- start:8422 stop:11115 length:2694 start_codon:yes stop_codon:yes gene_type:complete
MQLKQQSLIDLPKKKEKMNSKPTPMMSQYLEVKRRHQNYLLFYRMGDFYELFFDDAKIASQQLGIALTKRGKLNNKDIPMCGVPAHSAQTYLSRLIKLGFKVAIAEQLEKKSESIKNQKKNQKIFERDVVRIITPGTILEEPLLDSKKYNFLTSIYIKNGEGSVSWCDMTIGIFKTKNLKNSSLRQDLSELLYKIDPGEIITSEEIINNLLIKEELKNWKNKITLIHSTSFDLKNNNTKIQNFFKVSNTRSLGDLEDSDICSAGALIDYLYLTQKDNVPNILNINIIKDEEFMEVDKISSQSLEIFSRINGERKGSLIDVLDKTISACGARMLKEQIKNPLLNISEIQKRQNFVEHLINENSLIEKIRELIKGIPDVERSLSRVSAKLRNPRDLINVLNFIKKSIKVFTVIEFSKNLTLKKLLPSKKNIDELSSLQKLIEKNIETEPPISLQEGNVIRSNVNLHLDELRNIKDIQKKKILNLQIDYSTLSNLNSLKIKFNNFHGYFIEVTNKNSDKLLNCSEKKFYLIQNTLHAARFQTDELKKISLEIEQSEIKAIELEKEIYFKICKKILENNALINRTSNNIAYIDVMNNYAFISRQRNYIRPTFSGGKKLSIKQGRHPVVEESLILEEKQFTPNDCEIEIDKETWLMTGPNMAGKSTFLRQVAIICIMSQIGCYVPAKSVDIKIIDKVFTRVGASDDLSKGLSTFMTEMVETARILNGATKNSLIILDELGRGTSTNDGLSIAWAILEFIILKKKCLTFFATHYKELTYLKKRFPSISLKTMQIDEWQGNIIFLYKVIDGISKSSFGLHVAKLAGIQDSIIKRASEVLKNLSEKTFQKKDVKNKDEYFEFEDDENAHKKQEIFRLLKKINPDEINPKEALELLYSLKKKLSNK